MSTLRSNPLADAQFRVHMVLAMMLLALLVLGGWFWNIQVRRGPRYADDQERQSVRRVRLPGVRGSLVDRHGVVLADNRPSYNIVLYLEELRQPGPWAKTVAHVQGLLQRLEAVLGAPPALTEDDIRAHIRRSLPLPLVAWRDVDDVLMARFAEQAHGLKGVDIQFDSVRRYPLGERACHAAGYVGRAEIEQDEEDPYHYYLPEMTGRAGLEKTQDALLRGRAGGQLLRVDVTGYRRYEANRLEAERGSDVQLALDMDIQRMAEEALGDVPGAVVVLDPRNGDVLALASRPGFDPNGFVPAIPATLWKALRDDPHTPMFNRAAGGGYAPGSIFKPVTALAALGSGRAHAGDVHTCPGYFQLGRSTFRCWYHSGHGPLAMRQAVERSCNVYFFHAALAMGHESLAAEARALGLGSRTGIELDYETAGLVPDDVWKRRAVRDAWREGDTCNVAIGQGALVVSPLQMAVVTAALANGGKVWRPRLVTGVRGPGEERFRALEPDLVRTMPWRRVDLDVVRLGMRDVVQGAMGTARRVAIPGVEIAGKTGTAEFGRKDERKRHAWMIAFAPFEAPRYAAVMLVDEGISGGETAAPRMKLLLQGLLAQGLEREGQG